MNKKEERAKGRKENLDKLVKESEKKLEIIQKCGDSIHTHIF